MSHLSVTSTHLLNTSRDGDSTTSLGSLFQCLITLSVKKFFLISNLNFPWRREGQSIQLCSLWVWVMRIGTGQHTSLEVPVGAHSVHAQRKAMSVQQGQSLLQMHSLVFQECNVFGVSHSKGRLIISSKPIGRELTWLILSAKGRAEPHYETKELGVFT